MFDTVARRGAFLSSEHTCLICFCELLGTAFEILDGCGHSFCRECLSQHCKAQLSEGNMHGLGCPDPDCDRKIDAGLVKRLTDAELFERYDRHLLNFAIRSMSSTVWCPRISCQHPAQVCD